MNSAKPQRKKENPIKWDFFWKSKKNILYLSAVLIISFMVYLPSLQNGFVNWDDDINVYNNPYITDISNWKDFVANVKPIFTTHVNRGYHPLAILSFALEKIIYGLDSPGWWHLNNIILHLVCVLLAFRIALALGLKLIPAAFCALLFGIHPMRVESVAWITERRDVLYGSFYFLALYYYIKSVKLSFRKRYLLIIISSFILALLSKIQAVFLPLSMLLVDYYFDRRLNMKLVYEKWLYFLLSLITGIVGTNFLKVHGTLEVNNAVPVFKRILFGSYSYIVYIIKSVVPFEMVPLYPFPETISWAFYLCIAAVLSILGLTYYFFCNKKKAFVFGLLFFTFNIILLLQIRAIGAAFLADRYTYIAYFGLFFIYAYGLQFVLEKYGQFEKLIYLSALLILVVLGYVNYEQNKIWKNGETLWSHTLKYYNQVPFAWEKRANYYSNKGQLKEALLDYNKAIQYSPETRKGSNLLRRGITYAKLNKLGNALQDLNEAENLEPSNSDIFKNKSIINFNLGDYNKAQLELEKYLRLNSNNSDMWSNLGAISRINKQYENSLNAYSRAIQINPNNLAYYHGRLKTFYEMGNIQDARKDLNVLKTKGFKDISPDYERMINQGK